MLKIFQRNLSQVKSVNNRVQDLVLRKLNDRFGLSLAHAEVNNLSWQKDKPKDAETHLELIVVTSEFESMPKVERKKLLANLLKPELKGVEEITYRALTPSKWYDSNLRGLKLDPKYSNTPITAQVLEQSKQFYTQNLKNSSKQE